MDGGKGKDKMGERVVSGREGGVGGKVVSAKPKFNHYKLFQRLSKQNPKLARGDNQIS